MCKAWSIFWKFILTDLSELAKTFPESDKKVTFTINIPTRKCQNVRNYSVKKLQLVILIQEYTM